MRVELERIPLRTGDALYIGRIEAMRLHYKEKDGEETIRGRNEPISMGV